MHQILSAVNYCHSKRILHRDLKPQNILLDYHGIIKLADFGLARPIAVPARSLTHEIETLWYRAPEVILGQQDYSFPVDIWAIGCIFFELTTKKPLFAGDYEIDQLFKIFQALGTPNSESWPEVKTLPEYKDTFPQFKGTGIEEKLQGLIDSNGVDLLRQMIILDPAKRISARQALKHAYFDGLDTTDTLPMPI
jgi:serine/threonine protein kinase